VYYLYLYYYQFCFDFYLSVDLGNELAADAALATCLGNEVVFTTDGPLVAYEEL
jgi:hypothetical protein